MQYKRSLILASFLAAAVVSRAALAVSLVSLGCVLGGSGTREGCAPTLTDAVVGSFSEPVTFTHTLGSFAAGDAREYEVIGSYRQGNFDFYARTEGNAPAAFTGIGASGGYSIDGLVMNYTGAGPAPGGSVNISMNLHVAGTNTLLSPGSGDGLASGDLEFFGHLASASFDGAFNNYSGTVSRDGRSSSSVGLGTQVSGGGYLSSFDAVVTTAPVGVAVGTSFGAGFSFWNIASILGNSKFAEQSITGAGWIPGMQVFNTPQGYSVSSTDGLIVDNVFMPSAVVPVPPSVWLFISGLVGLVGVSRRSSRLS